jgi:trans-aconitate methyltransferase
MINNYNLLSKFYDIIYSRKPYKKELLYIKRLLPRSNFNNILEFGCGTGNYTKWINNIFSASEIVAVDNNKNMLAFAKKKKINANFIYGNLVNFKYNKNFDIIFCLFHVINYISSKKDLKNFFFNTHKLLNDDGFLVFDFLDLQSVSGTKPKNKKKKFKFENKKVTRITSSTLEKKNNIIKINHNYIVKSKNKIDQYNDKFNLKFIDINFIKKIIINKFIICYNYEWLSFKKPSKNNWSSVLVLKKIK